MNKLYSFCCFIFYQTSQKNVFNFEKMVFINKNLFNIKNHLEYRIITVTVTKRNYPGGKDKLNNIIKIKPNSNNSSISQKLKPNTSPPTTTDKDLPKANKTSCEKNTQVESQKTKPEIAGDFNSTRQDAENANLDPKTANNIHFRIFRDNNTTPEQLEEEESTTTENISEYQAIYINAPFHTLDSDGNANGPLNDSDHIHIAKKGEQGSLNIFLQATSSKGGTANGTVNNIKVSPIKYDGSFTPKKRIIKNGMDDDNNRLPNQKAPNPINDDFGNCIPDSEKGGQYVRVLPNTYVITEDEQKIIGIEKNTEATKFFNENHIKNKLDVLHNFTENRNDPSIVLSEESYAELQAEEGNNSSTDETLLSTNNEDID